MKCDNDRRPDAFHRESEKLDLASRHSRAVFFAAWTLALSVFCFLLVACTATPSATEAGSDATVGSLRHVPSPDWRDQVIYFVMIDRFDDGDPRNNDQGAGEFDPSSNAHYSGGDLAGIERRLDYIQGLGATAVWITPPVAHQWWDGSVNYGGYHGYWAENFMQVDAHFGDLAAYRSLAEALHGRGMALVQDVVVNHVGNFFRYDEPPDVSDPARGVTFNPDARPRPAPTQFPFSLNDPRRAEDCDAGIYHWTPNISDFADPVQEQTYQLAGLDDLDTENPRVRAALRESYNHWIREVGVDAFRVDTAFYVPPAYFRDFLFSDDATAPGVLRTAADTGRRDFHVFGEGFGLDTPFDDTQARRIDGYMRDADGPLLPGMINFPLYGSTLDVFARGRPTAVLGHRIANMMQVHANPHLMPSFVDNHDVDRFLAGGSEAALRQSLLLVLTLPGIPVIYYGTEQGFTEPRAAMFANGFGSDGRDRFDVEAPLYRFLQRAIALRREHPVLSRGTPNVLDANAAAAGALAYSMRDGDDVALVLFNSAEHTVLLDALDTGLPPGTRLVPVLSLDGDAVPLVVDASGRIALQLPARSGHVWLRSGTTGVPTPPDADVTLDPLADSVLRGDLVVTGTARGVASLQLVVDGNLATAKTVAPDRDGRWQASFDTASFVDSAVDHRVVAWSPGVVSAARSFRVECLWRDRIAQDDPPDDDHGPDGRYRYPTDPGWSVQRPLDIRRVGVETSGGSIRIDVQLRALIDEWNAPNGFDHIAITLFLELPGRPGGATVMPLQNVSLPNGMRWHYRLRSNGWTNALFSSDGATATHEGTAVSPTAGLQVDPATRTLSFVLPATSLGNVQELRGARLHVTTWDYSHFATTIAATPLPMKLVMARASDMKRSTPRISAMPATGTLPSPPGSPPAR
jgi:glycosidase